MYFYLFADLVIIDNTLSIIETITNFNTKLNSFVSIVLSIYSVFILDFGKIGDMPTMPSC